MKYDKDDPQLQYGGQSTKKIFFFHETENVTPIWTGIWGLHFLSREKKSFFWWTDHEIAVEGHLNHISPLNNSEMVIKPH